MLFALYALIFVIVALVVGLYFFVLKKHENQFGRVYKYFALATALVFFFRYMLGRSEVSNVIGLETVANPLSTFWGALMIWLATLCMLVFVLNAFYKVLTAKNLMTYVVLPLSAIGVILFFNTLPAVVGTPALGAFDIRSALLAIELALVFSGSLIVVLRQKKFAMSKAEGLNFALALPAMLLSTMPSYFLRTIYGLGPNIDLLEISPQHRIILYFAIGITFALYFAFKNKSEDSKRFMLLFFSLSTLISFSLRFLFAAYANPALWPLHLCNTAMYIIPLCLIFDLKKVFYFTYFINVLGAALAMLMPNYSNVGIFNPGMIEFWINHIPATILPILIVALKIYGRPTVKEFKYSMIGFAGYFLLVMGMNAWFSNYGTVDFFFINSDFVAKKLGRWAEDLRNVVISFQVGQNTFTLYPLYQFLYYLGYCVLGLGVWFVYENGFILAERTSELMRRRKLIAMDEMALKSQLGGKKSRAPINKEGADMIRIVNFSKKYGSSKVFAVKDANLEVHGGEIFGFLGPNGAGKSTIIKSLVGIQPITSGKVEICGYDVEKQSVEAKMNTGFVPDHYALYEKLTGREYINYIADLYQVSKANRDTRLSHFLKVFELEQAFDNQMKTYSHGMKQKIAIIAALIHNPKVWILDEPLTGLDPNSIYQVKEIMKQHAKAGNIVFFSSHIIDVVERICDRIAIIKQGTILCTKLIKDLEKDKVHLEDFYLNMIGEKLGSMHE